MKQKCGWALVVVAVASLALPVLGWAQDAADGVNLRRTVIVDVVQRTKDAVVLISAEKMVMQQVSPFGGDPFFQQFGPGEIVQRKANSLGSGFIIHEDGYVVTNNHVIDKARQITVELSDGRKLPATLISADADADLAILKISDPKPLPVLELGDSSDLMIGEPAIAVGNPLGYSHTVSTGIVSALHRDLKSSQGEVALGDLIQTDAAINPGNSGGPLLNAYGQVIGINTAIREDAQNIGFAIQVNRLRDLIPELMSPAAANKVEVPLVLKETRKIAEPATITTQVVSADSSAKRLVAINGHEPRDIVDAYARLLRVKAGQKLHVTWAGGEEVTLAATAVPTPDAVVQAKKRLGVGIEQVTPVLAKKLGLETEEGLLVTDVQPGSVAANAGIEKGDVMMALGHYRVSTLEDLSALIHHLPQQGKVGI
ncbi:MAG: trypsin-like peptidase domain-containing protein, partial [Tepidisphaeraceae bacterium]